MEISQVKEGDLAELLPLMRGYCDFYGVSPTDEALLEMSQALIADPEREGLQLLARDRGQPAGFATVFWSWSTLSAARIAVMNDLFVTEGSRGQGVGEALIKACLEQCRERGAAELGWQTAKDNHVAQSLYDRVGGRREEWVDYSLKV